jgi:hypothetical protein
MAAGGYISDQMTTQIVIDRITAPDWAEGFLLDGYPPRCHSSMTWTPISATPDTNWVPSSLCRPTVTK